jgi:hypothetical protein
MENLLPLFEWCGAERERLVKRRTALIGGGIATGENYGNGWVDTTLRDLLRVIDHIAELDVLLADYDIARADAQNQQLVRKENDRIAQLARIKQEIVTPVSCASFDWVPPTSDATYGES